MKNKTIDKKCLLTIEVDICFHNAKISFSLNYTSKQLSLLLEVVFATKLQYN